MLDFTRFTVPLLVLLLLTRSTLNVLTLAVLM
jgi:hypothetical protein